MKLSLNKFREQLFESLIDMAWRHWTLFGIAGHIDASTVNTILDPEALIIFSARFCRYDQRLYDLMLDWLMRYGSLINVMRLRSILDSSAYADASSIGYIASLLYKNGDSRWKNMASDLSSRHVLDKHALFIDWQTGADEFVAHADHDALQYGYIRNTYCPSNKLSSVIPLNSATTLLRTRGLFGVTARADIIALMLTAENYRVQPLAEMSGYAWKSVQEIIHELSICGYIHNIPTDKRGAVYQLTGAQKLKTLLNFKQCAFLPWRHLYSMLGTLWENTDNPHLADVSSQTLENEIISHWNSNLGTIVQPNSAFATPVISTGKVQKLFSVIKRL